MHKLNLALIVAAVVVGSGCSGSTNEEKIGKNQSASIPTDYAVDSNAANGNINSGGRYGWDVATGFAWPGGDGDPYDWGFCFLKKVEGLFASDKAELAMYPNLVDGFWHVKATKGNGDSNGGPKGKWGCHKFTDFTNIPPSYLAAASRYDVNLYVGGGGANSDTTPISGAGKLCPLTGVRGAFSPSSGNYRWSSVWDSGNGQTDLTIVRQSGSNIEASATTYCYHFPTTGFSWNRSNQVANQSGLSGGTTVTMANTTYETCFLESAGNALGNGDKTEVVVNGGTLYWDIFIGYDVQGGGLCIPYSQ